MKQGNNSGKFLKVMITSLVLLILGCLLAVLGVKAASSSGYQSSDSESNTVQEKSSEVKNTQQKVVKDFLLKPGGSPVSIETGGKKYSWNH